MNKDNIAEKDVITEETESPKKKKRGKVLTVLIITLILITGVLIGGWFMWQNMGYLTTDNARVTTTLVHISPSVPGVLERFTAYDGQIVTENEILGWVENDVALRSPIDGIIVFTSGVVGQMVMPGESLAVIADINDIHIEANIEETDIMRVELGQPVIITIDSLGNREFDAFISEIGRITTSELMGQSLFFNTGGTFTRITHLIPIRIDITEDVRLYDLLGTNARVRISQRDDFTPVPPDIDSDDRIVVNGVVESTARRNVYSMLGSTIERVNVAVGDRVTLGQTLAILNSEDLEFSIASQKIALELAQNDYVFTINDLWGAFGNTSGRFSPDTVLQLNRAVSQLNSAERNLTNANNNLESVMRDNVGNTNLITAENELTNARVNLFEVEESHRRQQVLYDAGIITSTVLRQSETNLTNANIRYNNASSAQEIILRSQGEYIEQMFDLVISAREARNQAQVNLTTIRADALRELGQAGSTYLIEQAENHITQMKLVLSQMESQLSRLEITAPIAGTVTAVFAEEGDIDGGLMFVIEDTQNLRVITSIREYDIDRIEVGTEVSITSAGTNDAVLSGIISKINPSATRYSPTTEFEVEITVTPNEIDLRIGMNVRVEIIDNR
ncbi:MAG: efflux RND transporter periplasmic adaptor subunit [Oscillospiraceae bacterium]|jgi:multidrug resistance efflux pump|nr:efflux RND transporter periplasmic adaptor subunit [Oscillospiraceae bacterium]